MKKHYFGFKHHSGTGKSRTLKEQQKQIRRRLIRKGCAAYHLPFMGCI